ncbi:uncharacterized protein PHACADRAFT_258157 [Phanerochaete carnosa HHB-10118-sp]|uniref:Uncharacterized protein n=1 Tax=Phanerochaete carnosa (strain HHB-10118-sp) TaxID=650164 RepID=K5W5Y0_PHACS|nr:uncharacterized protein PHACADRAFT_258157 [Phanerochaete carnosa HHB-10118-sp]EKM54354.1 hypothetical protein PHACADRAFT_258157 [Phanerochaete carnosa HHB-10118-sp]
MESKLKALKVVDLKEILSSAQVTVTGKANKSDLVAKILASPEAVKVYEQQYGSPENNDASAFAASHGTIPTSGVSDSQPVESQRKSAQYIETTTPEVAKPAASSSTVAPKSSAKPVSSVAPAAAQPSDTVAIVTPEDPELEKRKARAARFGIPLVEPAQSKASKAVEQTKDAKRTEDVPIGDSAKLEARAKRFGLSQAVTSTGKPELAKDNINRSRGNKRSAPAETVDSEEQEKRKKRAERFGFPVTSVNA